MNTFSLICILTGVLVSCAVSDGFQDDSKNISERILGSDIKRGSNYQVLLRDLFHFFENRYSGKSISEFDKQTKAWHWTRVSPIHEGVSSYVHYDINAIGYIPSQEFNHKLFLKVFVSDGRIASSEPYMEIQLNSDHNGLLKIGYSPSSVLGRFINLDSFKRKIKIAGGVDTLTISYRKFRYVSSATEAGIFCIEVRMRAAEGKEVDKYEYDVTSGLDYVSLAGESQPQAFKGTNTLIEPPFGWETIVEKNGERVFYCPSD